MPVNVPPLTETRLERVTQAVRELAEGRSNAVGQTTLDVAPATTTAVTAPACGAMSKVLLFPRTANAATELGAGGMYVSTVAAGTFTVTHSSSANVDRTFDYVCFG